MEGPQKRRTLERSVFSPSKKRTPFAKGFGKGIYGVFLQVAEIQKTVAVQQFFVAYRCFSEGFAGNLKIIRTCNSTVTQVCMIINGDSSS